MAPVSDILNSLIKKIRKLSDMIPCLYYYVPPCPGCGSANTGRYVSKPIMGTRADIRYVKNESLKHGELIRLVDKVPVANAYCEDCGKEWPEHIYARILPAYRVEEEKIKRGTVARLSAFQEANPKSQHFWNKFTGLFS